MTDGLKALMQKHAEELEGEQAAHRDALALCEVYEARIAELQSQLDAARAGSFVPVEDWEQYHSGATTIGQVASDLLVNLYGETLQFALPDGIRLCRLQPASAGSEGTVTDG